MSINTTRALNTLLGTDAYKLDHRRQYPDGTEYVYSNLTARSSRLDGVDATVFFGLTAVLEAITEEYSVFFSLTLDELDEVLARYEAFNTGVLGPNDIGSDHFRALWEVGYLPLEVRALAEGQVTPIGVPYFTIVNTLPDFFWLTNYLETRISADVWLPITSATIAWRLRGMLDAQAARAGTPEAVDFQAHDFSYRGLENTRAAALSGAGHLLSFLGSDTLPASLLAMDTYGEDTPPGLSVPATEHAVMMAGGQAGEFETFARLLDLYPSGILSVVSDTWNLWEVLTDFLPRLKDQILARDGKLVIRPDSGDPALILCGDPDADPDEPYYDERRRGVIGLLEDVFGTTENEKGFAELDPHIGVIYGDSITYERAELITNTLIERGYSPTIPVFGVGSFTFQYNTRDTFGMAMKATWCQVDGEGRDLRKDPITDRGDKRSASGRLAVRRQDDGRLVLVEKLDTPQDGDDSELVVVYRDGQIVNRPTFTEIRETLRRETEIHQNLKG